MLDSKKTPMTAVHAAKRFASLSLYPLIIVASLLAGRLIPAFYDWTGANQSRSSPWVGRAALGLLLCGFLVCLMLPWIPMDEDRGATIRARANQFKIRTILLMTALVAILLVVFRETPMTAVSGVMYILTLGYVARTWIHNRSLRIQVVALLACMYFPFAWLISLKLFSTWMPAMLGMASGLPSFLLALPIGRLMGYHSDEFAWIAILITSAELMLGVWVLRLGPRRFVAYLVFTFTVSLFGSFCLNALLRM